MVGEVEGWPGRRAMSGLQDIFEDGFIRQICCEQLRWTKLESRWPPGFGYRELLI